MMMMLALGNPWHHQLKLQLEVLPWSHSMGAAKCIHPLLELQLKWGREGAALALAVVLLRLLRLPMTHDDTHFPSFG